MSFPYDLPLKDLLTLFLFADLIVMAAVGIIAYKTRHKRGNVEQLLEQIRDLLRQGPGGYAEKLTSKTKSVESPKEEAVEEKPSDNKPKKEVPMPLIERERIYYEIEESMESSNDESSDLALVKNALKAGSVIKPLLKMPEYIEELVNKNRQKESPTDQTGVTTSGDSTLPPPPPPPTPTQTASSKKNEEKESD